MADSEFWRALELRFRALPDPQGLIRADWNCFDDNTDGWALAGELSLEVHQQFEELATIGGTELGPHGTDHMVTWLRALKDLKGIANCSGAIETLPDGRKVSHEQGSVLHLCSASADLCAAQSTRTARAEAIARAPQVPLHPIPSLLRYANDLMVDAELRARAQVLYEKKLKELRKQDAERELDEAVRQKAESQSSNVDSEKVGAAVKPEQRVSIGDQIRDLRDEAKLSQEELAELMDMDARTIQRHESNEVSPYGRTLRKYQKRFSKLLEREVVISKMP